MKERIIAKFLNNLSGFVTIARKTSNCCLSVDVRLCPIAP